MGFETVGIGGSKLIVGDHEAIPMGFETDIKSGISSLSDDHEAIPMGFETNSRIAPTIPYLSIMKPSLWDLKLVF